MPGPFRRLLILFAVLALVTLALAIVARWPQMVGWAAVFLVAEYGFSLTGRDGLDLAAPLFAVGVVVFVEMGMPLAGEPAPVGGDARSYEAQQIGVVASVLAISATATLALASGVAAPGSLMQALGVGAAAVALVLLVVVAGRRWRGRPDPAA